MTTASTRLEAIHSLAHVDVDRLPLGVNAIEINEDGIPCIAEPPRASRARFVARGLPFHAAVSPTGPDADEATGATCQVWAEVGVLPFTAQSPTKRQQILAILQGAQTLPTARFVVQGGQKIIVFSETTKDGRVTPEDIIYQTVALIQEAQPFLTLLGEQL